MLRGAYVFVAIVFIAIGASFIATTAMLAVEFWADSWVDIMAIDSHLFVFFPTLGLIALVAFYIPAVVFVDHYWRHVPWGKIRFLLGALVLIAAAHFIAQAILGSENRSIWELKPETLRADTGAPEDCLSSIGVKCDRLPLMEAMSNLRKLSQERIGLSEFVRRCDPDELIERSATEGPRRFCVATTPFSSKPDLLDDDSCCLAQKRLVTTVRDLYADPTTHSDTGKLHALLLPLKIYFLLILLSISFMLTWRFASIQSHYAGHMTTIEIGLIVGTFATLFFPLMSQAFLQSLEVLAGSSGRGTFSNIVPVLSVAFGLWAFLIVVFFFRRDGDNIEILTKIGSAAAGAIALIQYEVIVSHLVWAIGSGAQWFAIAGLVVFAIAAMIVTVRLMAYRPSPGQDALSPQDTSDRA